MRLIFIRHGDPDYVNDTLTEKGWKEAECLSKRVSKWENITDIYLSPLGRAKDTASLSLKKLNRTGITYDWLKEFWVPIENPNNHVVSVPWDFYPEYWTNDPILYDKDNWFNAKIYEGTDIKEKATEVFDGIDTLLAKYDYHRHDNYYLTNKTDDDTTLVFFCHLGVSCLILSHLLGLSPVVMWHSFFLAPTSVTIAATEERNPGKAQFRIQVMGDTRHLHDLNEPVSKAGYFTDVFNE